MKTITMDYEIYKQELDEKQDLGYIKGVRNAMSNVAEYLKTPLPFWKWWYVECSEEDKPSEHWRVILMALGREHEFNIPKNYNWNTGELE